MKSSRLLFVLMRLQARGHATARELAGELQVSVRTVLRDVDALSAAGVPIYAERGMGGGLRLREGWSTDVTGLTGPEAHALVLAGLPEAAMQLGLGHAAASARGKLLAGLDRSGRAIADHVMRRLHVDLMDWYRASEVPAFLPRVADAVWQGHPIRVRYRGWDQVRRRDLEPLGLVLKAGIWYMVARRTGQSELRTYRVAAIESLRALEGRFTWPRRFDLAAWWRDSIQRFEAERRHAVAHVRVSPRALNWLQNARTPYQAVAGAAEASAPDRPGWCELEMPIESLEHGTRAMLGFGTEVEVLGPPALRAHMAQAAHGLAERYPIAPKKPHVQRSWRRTGLRRSSASRHRRVRVNPRWNQTPAAKCVRWPRPSPLRSDRAASPPALARTG